MEPSHTIYIMMKTKYYYPESINKIIFWDYTPATNVSQDPVYADSLNTAGCALGDLIDEMDHNQLISITTGMPLDKKIPILEISKSNKGHIALGVRYTYLTNQELIKLTKALEKRIRYLHELKDI